MCSTGHSLVIEIIEIKICQIWPVKLEEGWIFLFCCFDSCETTASSKQTHGPALVLNWVLNFQCDLHLAAVVGDGEGKVSQIFL